MEELENAKVTGEDHLWEESEEESLLEELDKESFPKEDLLKELNQQEESLKKLEYLAWIEADTLENAEIESSDTEESSQIQRFQQKPRTSLEWRYTESELSEVASDTSTGSTSDISS